jgi:hypothetical protein
MGEIHTTQGEGRDKQETEEERENREGREGKAQTGVRGQSITPFDHLKRDECESG